GAEAERRDCFWNPAPQLARQVRRLLEQALLEEPEAVADLVDNAWAQRTDLVRLPEGGHLLGDGVADPVAARGGGGRVVGFAEQAAHTQVGREDGAPRRLRWVRREDELERARGDCSRQALVIDPRGRELGERRVQRFAPGLTLMLVLAAAPQPMVLLGEVG